MKEITSVNNSYIKEIAKLKEKKKRDEMKLFLVEGYNLVKEAKESNFLKEVFIVDEKDVVEGVINTFVTKEIINKLSTASSPQNIVGLCTFNEKELDYNENVLILDGVQDPGNLGTLIRSALNFNVKNIVLSKNSVDFYNPKVLRATEGAFFKLNICKKDITSVIDELKNNSYAIIGTNLNSNKSMQDIKCKDKYALVLGSEGNGVRDEVLRKTDYNITIKTTKELDSLNVAIAGSIIMHFLYNK